MSAGPATRDLAAEAWAALLLALIVLTAAAIGAPAPDDHGPGILPLTEATFRIDVNTADAPTLRLLPQIGPVYANGIIDERRDRPFVSADDMQRVRGIGPKRSALIAPHVVFSSDEPQATGEVPR